MNWNNRKVLVTGGASFIGSNLVERLAELGARILVVDDLSAGHKEYVPDDIEMLVGDLRDPEVLGLSMDFKPESVFHLAADHGGRGYVDLHQVECSTNFWLDAQLFDACRRNDVEQIVFASSGCIYPTQVQQDVTKDVFLQEDEAFPANADGMYGWAKLMAEEQLRWYHRQAGMKTASARYFTVYGPKGKEDHAVIAMIAKAFIRQDPFEIWGDGTQIRNWTHVDDIVAGTIRAAEEIEDGAAVNLGTSEQITVNQCAREVTALAGYTPEFKYLTDMPTGPLNRSASNKLAKELMGWEPQISFEQGVKQTWEWYADTKDVDAVRDIVENKLTER